MFKALAFIVLLAISAVSASNVKISTWVDDTCTIKGSSDDSPSTFCVTLDTCEDHSSSGNQMSFMASMNGADLEFKVYYGGYSSLFLASLFARPQSMILITFTFSFTFECEQLTVSTRLPT
jgi:hypothetical protein